MISLSPPIKAMALVRLLKASLRPQSPGIPFRLQSTEIPLAISSACAIVACACACCPVSACASAVALKITTQLPLSYPSFALSSMSVRLATTSARVARASSCWPFMDCILRISIKCRVRSSLSVIFFAVATAAAHSLHLVCASTIKPNASSRIARMYSGISLATANACARVVCAATSFPISRCASAIASNAFT